MAGEAGRAGDAALDRVAAPRAASTHPQLPRGRRNREAKRPAKPHGTDLKRGANLPREALAGSAAPEHANVAAKRTHQPAEHGAAPTASHLWRSAARQTSPKRAPARTKHPDTLHYLEGGRTGSGPHAKAAQADHAQRHKRERGRQNHATRTTRNGMHTHARRCHFTS